MGFEAMRLGETPWSKCKDSRGPGLSPELLPGEKSGAEEEPAEGAQK